VFYTCIQDDYRRTITELDEKEFVSLRLVIVEMRNHYVSFSFILFEIIGIFTELFWLFMGHFCRWTVCFGHIFFWFLIVLELYILTNFVDSLCSLSLFVYVIFIQLLVALHNKDVSFIHSAAFTCLLEFYVNIFSPSYLNRLGN